MSAFFISETSFRPHHKLTRAMNEIDQRQLKKIGSNRRRLICAAWTVPAVASVSLPKNGLALSIKFYNPPADATGTPKPLPPKK